jgi:hypothetical protein
LETDQRISPLLILWPRPWVSALSQDCLDRHHRINHKHADDLVLHPWLGAHEHVIALGDLPAHYAVSLDLQDEQVRPIL